MRCQDQKYSSQITQLSFNEAILGTRLEPRCYDKERVIEMCKPEKMRSRSTKEFCTRFILILLGAFLLSTDPTFPADKKEKAKTTTAGIPKLWRDPGDIASKDLYWGPG